MSTSTYRLPTNVSPLLYDVKLNAGVGRESFSGQVTITLAIHQETDTIDLHSRDLVVDNVNLIMDGLSLTAEVLTDANNERIVLQFAQILPRGEATLTLAFQGRIGQNLKGLYLAQDRPEQVLCTQCEATDARAIFPCFDEPIFKARFAVEVTTSDAVVLANAPLLSVTGDQTTKTWKFAATKIMSSYLFALVIGDLASTEEKVVNGIPLRVWSMRGKERMGSFALEYTARLLPWYENYFGVPYHFDKYDQAAVPGFSAGAMENSGLVIFRQNLLIMEPESSSWKQEKFIATLVSHEFAHMWFGNLVTMQWWDDLWLNEAFAQWMAFRVISELSPEYHIWDDFQEAQDHAFSADALDTTHAIYSPVQTPAQAQELFDVITYQKGCSVLRMLENFLGPESFREGLRSYMREFAERNACGSDLWNHLQAASRQPVAEIMESWILQEGYPCVTVVLETHNGRQQLQLSQKRFFTNPHATGDPSPCWQIPLVIRYADEAGIHSIRHLLYESTGLLQFSTDGEIKWILLNSGQIGFYRQNLTGPLQDKLLSHLDQLTASEQMGLLGDQWALTRRGDQSISQFLNFMEAMAYQCENYSLLAQIVERLHELEKMVEDCDNPAALGQFRRWVSRLFRKKLNIIGLEPRPGESVDISQQRVSFINALGSLAHDTRVIAQAGAMAELEATGPQSVDPNLAAIVLAIHAQFGEKELFNKYVDIYQARKACSAPPQTVSRYLYSFPYFRSPELVEQTLSLLHEGIAPSEAQGPVLYTMLQLHHARTAAWQYIKQNWSTIQEIGFWAGALIKSAGELPSSMRKDFVEFCEASVKGLADRSYAQALETMDLRAEFQARAQVELTQWLAIADSKE